VDKNLNTKTNYFNSKRLFIITGIAPLYIVLFGLTLYPFITNIYMSLVDYSLISSTKGKFILFQNYGAVVFDQRFWIVFKNTLYFSFGAVALELIIGMCIALLLNTLKDKFKFLRTIIILPMATASIAIAYVWILMMEPNVGLTTFLLQSVGLKSIETLSNPRLVMPTLIMIDAWQWTPFMIIIFTGRMLSLPAEPFEAAMVDGAGPIQAIRFITIPLLKPTMIFAVMLRLIDSFKIFDIIYLITKGGPGRSSESLSMYAFNLAFDRLEMGKGASLSIIMLGIQFILAIIFVKYSGIQSNSK
jgi:multiple sugar transport system permease protein